MNRQKSLILILLKEFKNYMDNHSSNNKIEYLQNFQISESTIQKAPAIDESTIQESIIEFDESTIQESINQKSTTIEFDNESTIIQESTIQHESILNESTTIQVDYNYIQNLPEKVPLNYFENEEKEEALSEKIFEPFSKLKILKNENNLDIITHDSEPKCKVEFDSSSLFPEVLHL